MPSTTTYRRAGSARIQVALICQSQHNCVQRGNVTAKNKGTWAVSAEADDFFELSGGLPQASPPRIEKKSPPIPFEKQRAPSGGYPRGAPLGSLLHPFLERKGCARPGMRGRHPPAGGGYRAGGQCPQPSRAVVPLATKMREMRQCYKSVSYTHLDVYKRQSCV